MAPDADKVVAAVCDFYQVSSKELLFSKRGSENLPRDVAIYLVRRLCRMTLPEVGSEFGIGNYSTVSSAIQRVKSRTEGGKQLGQELDGIAKKVTKGQKRT